MNKIKKFIIFMIFYSLVIILFGFSYYITQCKHKDCKFDKLNSWSELISSRQQLNNIELIKTKNGYKFTEKKKTGFRKHNSIFKCISFSSATFSTVGYYNILQNTYPHIIINMINLILVICIVPILIFIFNNDLKSLFHNLFIELSICLVFSICYKIVNYYDVKNKAKYDDFMFSVSGLKLLTFKQQKNKLKLETSPKLWYQWIVYSWRDCFYWSLITQSRVGYGSIWYPVTKNEVIVNFIHQLVIIFITCYLIFIATATK